MNRERSLYGTEFEVKLRNELTQKAIAKECAEWIKNKVTFKSNTSDKSIQGQIVVDGIGYTPINNFTTVECGVWNEELTLDENLAFHEKQAKLEKEIARLEKRARAEKQPRKKFELVQKIKELKEKG